jgi:Tryptophan 2,3-dioxygenase
MSLPPATVTSSQCRCRRFSGLSMGNHSLMPSRMPPDATQLLFSEQLDALDLYELAEELVDLEDWFPQWRLRQVTTVERVVGHKAGTGGTSGVAYLRRAIDLCCLFRAAAGADRTVGPRADRADRALAASRVGRERRSAISAPTLSRLRWRPSRWSRSARARAGPARRAAAARSWRSRTAARDRARRPRHTRAARPPSRRR